MGTGQKKGKTPRGTKNTIGKSVKEVCLVVAKGHDSTTVESLELLHPNQSEYGAGGAPNQVITRQYNVVLANLTFSRNVASDNVGLKEEVLDASSQDSGEDAGKEDRNQGYPKNGGEAHEGKKQL